MPRLSKASHKGKFSTTITIKIKKTQFINTRLALKIYICNKFNKNHQIHSPKIDDNK